MGASMAGAPNDSRSVAPAIRTNDMDLEFSNQFRKPSVARIPEMNESMVSEFMPNDLAPKQTIKGSIMTAQIVKGHTAKLEDDFFKYSGKMLVGKQRRRCKIDSKGWFSYYKNGECKGFFLLGPETSVRFDPDLHYKWYLTASTEVSAMGSEAKSNREFTFEDCDKNVDRVKNWVSSIKMIADAFA
jgi:hypothetical protein